MVKRYWVFLILAFVASSAFATGAKEETRQSIDVSAPGVYPIVKDKISLTFLQVKVPSVPDIATNKFTQYLEKLTNVHIVWDIALDNTAVRLSLASGDLPDVLFGNNSITPVEEQQFSSQGMIIPLESLIDRYSVNIKKVLSDYPALRKSITLPDNHIYQLPNAALDNHSFVAAKAWIYKPWLDKLGLKVPTTTDEFYQTLKAFKERDPNGNGKADEIPMSGAIKTWNARPDDFLMNAFILNNPGTGRLVVRNGKADYAPAKAEWKDGLAFINKLYSEGLIEPGAYTQDLGLMGQKAENKDLAILGSYAAGHLAMGWSLNPGGRAGQGTAIYPLKGPKGVQVTPWGRGGPDMMVQGPNGYAVAIVKWPAFFITKASLYPEVAIKWADFFFTEEGYLWSQAGEKGVDWRPAKPGELGWAEQPAIWAPMEQSAQIGPGLNAHWEANNPGWNGIPTRLGRALTGPDDYNLLLGKVSTPYTKFASKEEFPVFYIPVKYVDELATLTTLLANYVDESMVRFITGDRNITTEWDAYVKQLETLGLKRYLEIQQDAYDQSMKIK